ncbi:MAG: nitroreductase family protein [Candidatus Diapherotrites archaeon]|nr:nitroreductase family protein [Candidatus Diapherotrites archaeon]
MDFSEVLEKRHSVRKFIQGKEIPPAMIEELLEAANNSPSAGGLKAREILVITDEKIKKLISDSAHNQKDDFIVKAGVVLIFCADKEKNKEKFSERGKIYASQDATIACAFAHLKAVDLGLASCFVGSFNEQQLIESLELKQNLYPIHILPIGFEEK